MDPGTKKGYCIMPIKRAAKKKKSLGDSRFAGRGSSSREYSDLRPEHVEKLAPCMAGCPQGTDIRGIINEISLHEKHGITLDEAFERAWKRLVQTNPLPAVCGRVCPHPCEGECNRKNKDKAVSINQIERAIGDYGLDHELTLAQAEEFEERAEKVAVIGSGPAGLAAAYHLAKRGYKVTIFEAFAKTGGMLRYGIPDYRLPQDVLDAEVQRILDMGVELKTNTTVGKDIPYEDVKNEYDAVFVGIGAHKGRKLRLDGEDAENVYTGTSFLNLVNSGTPPDVGDKVVVVGGGDTAIDAARVAKRLGATEVTLLYRRTRQEMPAIDEEIEGAEEEGIPMEFLATPVEIVTEGDKAVKIKCQKMELGEPDSSGRRRPVPIDEFFEKEITFLIPAISQEPEFDGLEDVKAGPKDWVKPDEYMEVTEDGKVVAGGDVTDLGLVTIALYQGRRAADTIHARFRDLPLEYDPKPPVVPTERVLLDYFEVKERKEPHQVPVEERFDGDENKEIAQTLAQDEVLAEAARCMSCGMCFECGQCWSYCQDGAINKPVKPGDKYTFKLDTCKGCEKCKEVCPCGYIEMK
ncbi:FAD-dependent oxidoreductase [bacterium]|nr:FAD-dependent oxidoreductase [bacterium]